MTSYLNNFILIDDDPASNMICSAVIKKVFTNANVISFLRPDEALIFIEKECVKPECSRSVLFLDINMPALSGWEFLEEFKNFNTEIKKKIKIFMLTSSVAESDKVRAVDNNLVSSLISKPLRKETLKHLISPVAAA